MECCKRRPSAPIPSKLFMGLILSAEADLSAFKQKASSQFGAIDVETSLFTFDHTGYYNCEMGTGLKRCFISFLNTISPDRLAEIKCITNQLEMEEGVIKGDRIYRMINCDPGILSLANIILATTKNHAHRIYLSRGIYAEVTLLYSKSQGWLPLEWTYPDYRTDQALKFFEKLRTIYHLQIKALLHQASLTKEHLKDKLGV